MTSLQITHATLQKLTHESNEIRLRALEQVEGKILRALAHNETIAFKPGELCKQLIRWFGHKPLQSAGKVLDLLSRILRSKYGDVAVDQLGLERFKREMGKVETLLHGRSKELQILAEIKSNLEQRTERGSAIDELDDLVEVIETVNLSDTDSQKEAPLLERLAVTCLAVDYEVAWSKPTVADYNSLKCLADILVNPCATAVELQNTLQHLQITMADYPAEYLLQTPNIFLKLLQLFQNAEQFKCPLEDVADTLLAVLRLLRKRLRMRRQCLAYAPAPDSCEISGKTQLKVEKALQMLLQSVLEYLQQNVLQSRNELPHLMELAFAALKIHRLQQLCIERPNMRRLYSICEKLRNSCEKDEHFTTQRQKYLYFCFLLQDAAANNASRQPFLDIDMFSHQMCDYTLHMNFPQRYERISKLLYPTVDGHARRQVTLDKYKRSYNIAMALLRDRKSMPSTQLVQLNAADSCYVLAQLQSGKLLELLFNAIVDCNAACPANAPLRQASTELLLGMLQQENVSLRELAHQKLVIAMKRHFACLMNGECYSAAISNAKLLDCQIIGVPLSLELILHLVQESHDSPSGAIKRHCIDLLTMLFKASHLLADNWLPLLAMLIPALPLLQCCTHAPQLAQQVLQLYDPDAGKLPLATVLQGNVGLLFHPDTAMRSEALIRLIYTLNGSDSCHYVPNIMEISDLLPNDLCLLRVPRQLNRIFVASEIFAELSTLQTLLDLLDTRDIEPLIRKTTLMQLNVMCQNWPVCVAFCKEGACYLVLQALENSLRVDSYEDYTDAAIPAVSILAKALCCDVWLRQHLVNKPNIYMLLLRALLLYQNDIQLRQDASICLLLLVYASYVVVVGAGERVELPSIVGNLQLPLHCELRSHRVNIADSGADFKALFPSEAAQAAYLRPLLAAAYCGGYEKLTSKYLETQCQLDICATLQLTLRDWRLIKASSPSLSMRRLLQAIANCSDHVTLARAALHMKVQLLLQSFDAIDALPSQLTKELYSLLNRYVQLPPGNEADFQLYEQLLELCALCVHLPLPDVVMAICQALHQDFQHAFVTLLRHDELPLRLYRKLCHLHAPLLSATLPLEPRSQAAQAASIFHSNFYELLFQTTTELFQRRELQRARCLLSLLQLCSVRHLHMPDESLLYHSKRLLSFSLALKSFGQTGAQWQRDCLQQVCQLYSQMTQAHHVFKLNTNCLKYLSGLCGHSDAQVRALAWCVLAAVSRNVDVETKDAVGANLLMTELAYLPGGFLACCLCTSVDESEVLLVRQLAGQLFAELITDATDTLRLLEQHDFFRGAHASLADCRFERTVPTHDAGNARIANCELVSVYCRICMSLLKLRADYVQALCEKPLLHKLYELLKLPPAHSHRAYYTMCAHICQLYGMCYAHNFGFLQRTLCRDQVWLLAYSHLLEQPHDASEQEVVSVLQLLLVLCQDAVAYEKLCENFAQAPQCVVRLLLRAFDVPKLNTHLQRCGLAVLALLLVKSQPELELSHQTFAQLLDEALLEPDMCPTAGSAECNKENVCHNSAAGEQPNSGKDTQRSWDESLTTINSAKSSGKAAATVTATNNATPASALVFNQLLRLFVHLYTSKACKFESAPSTSKMQVNETLAMLLKVSPVAQQSAQHLKLFDQIIRIFHSFFEEFSTSCTTFVRRYGEMRKMAIVKNFQLLCSLLLNWYSSPTAVLRQELQAHELTKILIRIWPWLAHSSDLKLLVLQLCVFVSEQAPIVCQQFATLIASYAHSVLQLVVKIVVYETTKVKAISTENSEYIAAGMRVLVNCCSCAEGRFCLLKERVLDTFDVMNPFTAKAPKLRPEILLSWLQFWEIFSSHADGAGIRNVNALCALVQRSTPHSPRRLHALRILRNMCFLPCNRSQMITCTEFLYMLHDIVAQPLQPVNNATISYSYEEQLITTVAVSQLITAGVKYVAMMRGTKLAKKFRMLREHLQTLEAEDSEHVEQSPFGVQLVVALDELLRKITST